ncbi:hypothetical protein ScPMuIL_003665 [Solemya velum]
MSKNQDQPPPYAPAGQPYGYGPPPPQGQNTTVIMQQPTTIAVVQHLGNTPMRTRCAACGADVVTATYYETGSMTWLIAIILCFVGGLLCCFIPFCIDDCKDVVHQCPNCQNQIGRFNRM